MHILQVHTNLIKGGLWVNDVLWCSCKPLCVCSVQEKLEILNDRLEQVTGTEKDADDGMDGAQSIKQSVKKCK